MDFELGSRQKQIRLAAREFAEGELAPISVIGGEGLKRQTKEAYRR